MEPNIIFPLLNKFDAKNNNKIQRIEEKINLQRFMERILLSWSNNWNVS